MAHFVQETSNAQYKWSDSRYEHHVNSVSKHIADAEATQLDSTAESRRLCVLGFTG